MKTLRAILALAGFLSLAGAATANNFVVNGGFEQTTIPVTKSTEFGSRYGGQIVTGWTTDGYNFLILPNTIQTIGADSEYGSSNVKLWGPLNGSNNGFVDSPSGGNYIGADGDYYTGPISQTITGLTMGEKYTVGFDYAFSQQYGYSGATIQGWTVSLGGDSRSVPDFGLGDHGFSGWSHQNFTFTATGADEVLSFLAYGNVQLPPFALLDDVTLYAGVGVVPEPAAWALMLMGVAGLGGVARLRRRQAIAAV
jgi:hypothetical protein